MLATNQREPQVWPLATLAASDLRRSGRRLRVRAFFVWIKENLGYRIDVRHITIYSSHHLHCSDCTCLKTYFFSKIKNLGGIENFISKRCKNLIHGLCTRFGHSKYHKSGVSNIFNHFWNWKMLSKIIIVNFWLISFKK